MFFVQNKNTNPYFNLALEEYLLKECQGEYFLLWQNEPCVVVGKNQNTLAEINYKYVKENDVKLTRRISGGGAVFHDLGNLNFTFIQDGVNNLFLDYRKSITPIVESLQIIGLNVDLTDRNDLQIEGKKISGNAQYKYKNRALHHGTLLFDSALEDIGISLNPEQSKFQGKRVKSIKSEVTNIKNHLQEPLSLQEFQKLILDTVASKYETFSTYEPTSDDIIKINKLAQEKYFSWEWIYGASPEYLMEVQIGLTLLKLKVKSGIIQNTIIESDIQELGESLIGVMLEENSVRGVLREFETKYPNFNLAEFIDDIF